MRSVGLNLLVIISLAGIACSRHGDDESIADTPLAAIAGEDIVDEPRTAATEIRIAEGTLVNIDAERKFLWVRIWEGGDEVLFRYTPNTQVQGFGELAEGLRDKFTVDGLGDAVKGATVKVHYRPDADLVVPYNAAINTAVKIELDRPL